jgi:hypothetical protein
MNTTPIAVLVALIVSVGAADACEGQLRRTITESPLLLPASWATPAPGELVLTGRSPTPSAMPPTMAPTQDLAEPPSFTETAVLSSVGSLLGLIGGFAVAYPTQNLMAFGALGFTGSVSGAAIIGSRGTNDGALAWGGSLLGSVLGIVVANTFDASGGAALLGYSLTHGFTTAALASGWRP